MREIEVVEIGTFTSYSTAVRGVFFVQDKDIVTVKGSDEMATVKA